MTDNNNDWVNRYVLWNVSPTDHKTIQNTFTEATKQFYSEEEQAACYDLTSDEKLQIEKMFPGVKVDDGNDLMIPNGKPHPPYLRENKIV